MKYVYDILLNFNEKLYEFYEWMDDDYFDYIKRIGIIKVSKDTLIDIKTNKIMIDDELVKQIKNTCEIYTNKSTKFVEYACLFCSNSLVLAVEFNYKGISIMKSDLLIDEALDIIEVCKKMKPINLNYKIINKEEYNNLITRKEEEMINFMKRKINIIYKNKKIDKLKYLYYECFKKEEDNILTIYNDLINYTSSFPINLYDLLMLTK